MRYFVQCLKTYIERIKLKLKQPRVDRFFIDSKIFCKLFLDQQVDDLETSEI